MKQNTIQEENSEYITEWRSRERAVQKAILAAVLEHKRAGNPIAVWRDGKVVIVQPEDIDVSEEMLANET